MLFDDLRLAVLDLLQDAGSAVAGVPNAKVNRVINAAYVEMVNEIERVSPVFNMSSKTLTLTTTSGGQREYNLRTASEVVPNTDGTPEEAPFMRKPVDVSADGGGFAAYNMPIVPFSERDRSSGRLFGRSIVTPNDAVYFYRQVDPLATTPQMDWYIGFIRNPTLPSSIYYIRYLPAIETLEQETDPPVQVPEQWHYNIALRAALVVKTMEGRDTGPIGLAYGESLDRMRSDLSTLTAQNQSQAF